MKPCFRKCLVKSDLSIHRIIIIIVNYNNIIIIIITYFNYNYLDIDISFLVNPCFVVTNGLMNEMCYCGVTVTRGVDNCFSCVAVAEPHAAKFTSTFVSMMTFAF